MMSEEQYNDKMEEEEKTLSKILETRKFCIYCTTAPEFCTCTNVIKYAVWKDTITGDIADAVRRLKEEFKDGWDYSALSLHNAIDKIFGSELAGVEE